jgi:hypothetical protein
MNKANEESYDSPFRINGCARKAQNTKIIKQKLCGGISEASPTYFHIQHATVLDPMSRTQELLKGYNLKETSDFKLVRHPELEVQEKKYFAYEDYKSNRMIGQRPFDYATMKPSNLIDLLADKRPEFKMSSNFYKKYKERLAKEGFGLTRGIFTIESNQRHKFGQTLSSRFCTLERYSNPDSFSPSLLPKRKSLRNRRSQNSHRTANQLR